MSFDSAAPGTPEWAWNADPRMHDRPALALGDADELVVVAAHPDDETLGAGGLIAHAASAGLPVLVVVVTDGAASHPGAPGLAERRAAELAAAVHTLAPEARITLLGFPDGQTAEHADDIATALAPILAGASAAAVVAAPWQGDGHRDHRIVGEIVAGLVGERLLLEYPIWMWHWAAPDHPAVPWHRLVSLAVDPATTSAAIAHFGSQLEGESPVLRPDVVEYFRRDRELFVAADHRAGGGRGASAAAEAAPAPAGHAGPVESAVSIESVAPAASAETSVSAETSTEDRILGRDYFDGIYAHSPDPWRFRSRWYERRKRELLLAALPQERYGRALEIGCSIGVLTELLADRCDNLLALDISAEAVERASALVGHRATVEQRDVLRDFPPGSFDLVVLSEVGYYWGADGLRRSLDNIRAALTPGGTLVACHWRHPVDDYPMSGDAVHEEIRRRDGWSRIALHLEDDFVLEVYSDDPRSVARREGFL